VTEHCPHCGAPTWRALAPTGEVIALDTQQSAFGGYRLAKGPDGMSFAMRDGKGDGPRYSRHDGGSCTGIRTGAARLGTFPDRPFV